MYCTRREPDVCTVQSRQAGVARAVWFVHFASHDFGKCAAVGVPVGEEELGSVKPKDAPGEQGNKLFGPDDTLNFDIASSLAFL